MVNKMGGYKKIMNFGIVHDVGENGIPVKTTSNITKLDVHFHNSTKKTLLLVKVTNDLRVAKSSGQYKPVSIPETDPQSTFLFSVNGGSVLLVA